MFLVWNRLEVVKTWERLMWEKRELFLFRSKILWALCMGEEKHEGKTNLPFPDRVCDAILPCRVKMNNYKYIPIFPI